MLFSLFNQKLHAPEQGTGSRPRLRLGLALGGGGARGWAHIGVLRRLHAAGIIPDIIAGTSIGAVVGGCAIAGKLDELETFALSLSPRKILRLLDLNLTGSGLIWGDKLSDLLERDLSEATIESLPRRFVAVATELATGHEVWLTRGRLIDALRASYALPGIFTPVKAGGKWLVDGALVNPVPVTVCRALGADLVVAVNLSYDTGSRGGVIHDHNAAPDSFPEPTAEKSMTERAIGLLRRQLDGKPDGPPGIATVMIDVFNITQDRIARSRLAGDPPDVTINPRVGKIGLFDFHKAAEAVSLGMEATDRMLAEISDRVVGM